MDWIVKQGEKNTAMTPPAFLSGDHSAIIKVGGEKLSVRWDETSQTLFVAQPSASGLTIERVINLRSLTVTKQDLDIKIAWERFTNRLVQGQATLVPDIPGHTSRQRSRQAQGAVLRSPMTGKVLRILVKNGDTVTRGQELLIIEAMKMENKMFADADGVVNGLKVAEGATVATNDTLLTIKPEQL